MSRSPHPTFGPGYVPPAERIRRERASARQPGPGHDFRPRHTRGEGNGFNPWFVGLVVVVGSAFLIAGALRLFDSLEHTNGSCRGLDEAIGHYLDVDPNAQRVHIERSRDILEEAEILARVSGEFAVALESLELTDPGASDLRDRFVDHAWDTKEVWGSYRCTFIANQAQVCDVVPPGALEEVDRERAALFEDFNQMCRHTGLEWKLEPE